MRGIRQRCIIGVACIFLILSGCSDGGNGTNDDPMYQEIEQVLDGLVDNWNAGDYASLEDAYQAAADFLKGQAIVKKVQLRTGEGMPSLWADFSNGITFVMPSIYDAFEVDQEDLPHPAPPGTPYEIGEFGLPGRQALFLQLVGIPSTAWKASAWADHSGYLPTYGTDEAGQIAFFSTLSNYQLVYISSHGAFLKRDDGDLFALMTGEMRDKDKDEAFKKSGDFDSKRILLAMTVPEVGVGEYSIPELQKKATRYAVSDRYIDANNGNFDQFSLVVLDACESAMPNNPPYPGNPLVKVLLAKQVGGVLGWDKSVSPAASLRAMKYLFSRLFGDDSQDWPAHPPTRPFGVTTTHEAMQKLTFDIDNMPNPKDPSYVPSLAKLVWAPQDFGNQNSQQDVLLRPTIDRIDVSNLVSDQEIELLGDFGKEEGEVCFDGNCSSAKDWDVNSVIATCNADQHGLISVKVNERTSNEAPLSQWNGVFKAEGDLDTEIGPHIKVDFNFKFRSDIHKSRISPEKDPDPTFDDYVAMFEEGQECNFTVTGRDPPFEDENYIYEYTGEGVSSISSDGGEYSGAVFIRPMKGEMEFQITCGVHAILTKIDKDTNIPEDPEQFDFFVIGMFKPKIDEYGTIESGEDSLLTGLANVPIKWDQVEPETPPDEKTPG